MEDVVRKGKVTRNDEVNSQYDDIDNYDNATVSV